MLFSDFAYSGTMQIILAFLSVAASVVFQRSAIDLILAFYDEEIAPRQKLIYLLVVGVVLYNGIIYFAYILGGFVTFDDRLETALILPTPLQLFAGYFVMTRIWKFPGHRIVHILRHVYFYSLALSSVSLLFTRLSSPDPLRPNYLLTAIAIFIYIPLCLTVGKFLTHFIKHSEFIIRLPSHISEDFKHFFLGNSLAATAVYCCSVIFLGCFPASVPAHLLVALALFLMLICDIMIIHKYSLTSELDNKNSFIANLTTKVYEYIKVKNEFNTILQTYDRLLESGNFDDISAYHESLMGTAAEIPSVSISALMSQNPSFVSLLLGKLEYARREGVQMFTPLLCSLEDMYIEEFDLGRLVGNLLNNAIEAAAVSESRKLDFSVIQKGTDRKLIIITNSTTELVDIDSVMGYGVTTKPDHTGVGLTQVRNIVRRYPNCTLNFSCQKNEFSAYVELRQAQKITAGIV